MMGVKLPRWAAWLTAAAAGVALYVFGRMDGERIAGAEHTDYVRAQAVRAAIIAKAQTKVVIQTEIKYLDRIKTVYVKGETIEKQVPIYVTRDDDDRYGVNAGFVRSYNAAWAGELAGPAADTDREPAGVPLSEVAEVDAHNATACRAWREQALGWREFYSRLRGLQTSSADVCTSNLDWDSCQLMMHSGKILESNFVRGQHGLL